MDEEDQDLELGKKLETDIAIRKELRVQQRKVASLAHASKIMFANVKSGKLEDVREANNRLWLSGIVRHSRELQNDALIVRDLAYGAKAQSAALDDAFSGYDFGEFAHKLKRRYTRGASFSWTDCGGSVGHIFSCPPLVDTMLGPIAKEMKVRKVAVRQQKEHLGEVVKPVAEEQDDEDEATNERLLRVREVVTDLSADPEKPFDLLHLLVDPIDNVQTVENFFDFCFIVKEKQAVVQLNASTHLPLALGVPLGSEEVEALEKQQMVLTLNMGELASLVSFANTQDNTGKMVPFSLKNQLHRNDEIYRAQTARQQTEIIQREQEVRKRRRQQSGARKKELTGLIGHGATNGMRNARVETIDSSSLSPKLVVAPIVMPGAASNGYTNGHVNKHDNKLTNGHLDNRSMVVSPKHTAKRRRADGVTAAKAIGSSTDDDESGNDSEDDDVE